jgi:hypothetical protein
MTEKGKRGKGRPKLDDSKSVMLSARFTTAEAREISEAVNRSGQGKTEWMQKTLLAAARLDKL